MLPLKRICTFGLKTWKYNGLWRWKTYHHRFWSMQVWKFEQKKGLILYRQTSADTPLTCWVGSQDYAAPEIIRRIPYNGFTADVYSLGVILYIMLTGELPFSRSARYNAMEKGTYPPLVFPSSCIASSNAKSLCVRMLDPEPNKRITMQDIQQHPWVCDLRRTRSLGSNPFANLIKNIRKQLQIE